ncbi:MAG TPA: threonine synthase, partial [Afifellaceae bacterium]|nr:threonine synthase [Afifellaceae bacterium]
MAVSDEALLEARDRIAAEDGLLLCPEGAATAAAYARALEEGLVGRDETAILFNCATGLKYPMAPVTTELKKGAEIDYGMFGR